MNTTDNYRYPGSRPFQDTDHDRRLFFGRDQEKESLLHLVLAENLVVLFAKSGMGKTSLLNAGLLQPLRERSFIPFKIRFNDSKIDPLQAVYSGIEDTVEQHEIEYTSGEKNTLWQYFKTVEFWSTEDTLLTPVLILDQFEDFFALHPPKERQNFITQLADLVKGRIPQDLRESLQSKKEISYTETSPKVKIITSIREDFLGQLEEMSREIPDILHNRFRLLPLHREQARQAIIEPAVQLQDNLIKSRKFRYASETVEAILDFLCKRKVQDEFISTDEVEPFQLQLLCQHIENTVREKPEEKGTDVTVQKDDLGGEVGMQKVLENFYDNQINRLEAKSKKRVRNLFEKGLISLTDRRLSLEEEDIYRRFKVQKGLLVKLVGSHLLRAEPRVGSIYYELSHDTLIDPIRHSQKKRTVKKNKIRAIIVGAILFFVVVILALSLKSIIYRQALQLSAERNFTKAATYYRVLIWLDNRFTEAYTGLGQILIEQGKFDEAITVYENAINNNIQDAEIFYHLGKVFSYKGENAIETYRQENIDSTIVNSDDSYNELKALYQTQESIQKAIKNYEQALRMHNQHGNIYKDLAALYIKQGYFDQAIATYQQALKVNPEYAPIYIALVEILNQIEMEEDIKQIYEEEYIKQIYEAASTVILKDASYYVKLGYGFSQLGWYDKAILNYQRAIQLAPTWGALYNSLGFAFFQQAKYDEAVRNYQKAIRLEPDRGAFYNNLGFALYKQEKYDEAIKHFSKATEIDAQNATAYKGLAHALKKTMRYEEAITNYRMAIQFAPDDIYAYTGLASALHKQGKYDEAIANYKKAIEIDPRDVYAYEKLEELFKEQEKFDEITVLYQQAIERDDVDAFFCEKLGKMCKK